MTYLKKNKLIIFFFILGIFQIYYLFDKRSNFQTEILKNPFKRDSHANLTLPDIVIEANQILKSKNIISFNLSENIKKDMYLYQRIIEFNYPIKFSENSKFFITPFEENKKNCEKISEKKLVSLYKCK